MSKESIKEIDSRLKMAEDAEREQLMKVYAPDDRAGVQKLLEKYRKQKEKLLAEKERLAKMRQNEEKYADYKAENEKFLAENKTKDGVKLLQAVCNTK